MTRPTQVILKALLIAYVAFWFTVDEQIGYLLLAPAVIGLCVPKVNK